MNLLALLEWLGALMALMALGRVMAPGRRRGPLRPILFALVLATLLFHVAEAIEWSGDVRLVATAEMMAVLLPVLWLFLMTAYGRELLLSRVLEQTRQRQAVLEHAPVALALLNDQGRLIAWSSSWAALWPETRLVVGAGIPDTELGALLRPLVVEAIAAGGPLTTEEPVHLVGTKPRWYHVSSRPWQGSDDEMGGLVLLVDDVTEQRQVDAEIFREQDSVQKGNRLELVGLVAAGVAHDIRNVLTGLSFYSEVLRDSDVSRHDLDEAAEAIRDAVGTSTGLLGSLAGLTQAEKRAHRVDLTRLLAESRRMLARGLPADQWLTLVDETDAPVFVNAVEVKIQQVLLNLVVNAREAMNGGGEINVRLSTDVRDGKPFAVISVTDQGCGMSQALVGRVFDALYTTKGSGTGLGLAIVKSIVVEYGGRLSVDSTVGVGTTFEVLLPQLSEHDGQSRDSEPTESAPATGAPGPSGNGSRYFKTAHLTTPLEGVPAQH